MCLIFIGYRLNEKYPLLILANRDEYHSRATSFAHWWTANEPQKQPILAGKDDKKGGTWLGVNKTGKFAALTNFRSPQKSNLPLASRGIFVRDFLQGSLSAQQFCEQIPSGFAGYSLLLYDGSELIYQTNVPDNIVKSTMGNVSPTSYCSLSHGLYGLSNANLDSNWPKVISGKSNFSALLDNWLVEENHQSTQAKGTQRLCRSLIDMMKDITQAKDNELPDTGVGIDKERWLSSRFIRGETYGTRNTTLVLVRTDGYTKLIERNFLQNATVCETREFSFLSAGVGNPLYEFNSY